jgi:hypothetical protein
VSRLDTSISNQKHFPTMFRNAQRMVLHAGRSTNVAQDNNLHSLSKFLVNGLLAILGYLFELCAIIVDVSDGEVLASIILLGKCDEQYGKQGRKSDYDIQHRREVVVGPVDRESLGAHGGRVRATLRYGWVKRAVTFPCAAACVTGARGFSGRCGESAGVRPKGEGA